MPSQPPDETDFLGFFEAEPSLLDLRVPWIYNTATYRTERDGLVVTFQISPSYSSLKVSLARNGQEIAEAEVTSFTSLEIATNGGRETLVARFGDLAASGLFLTLRPHVKLAVTAGSDA